MGVRFYKDLKVWQKSMDLAVNIYETVKLLPSEELFGLSGQMRRAAVSIPSNIAEGQQRNTTKEFSHFISIAQGSLGELETQIILCERLAYLKETQTQPLLELCAEIGKMLYGLKNNLQ